MLSAERPQFRAQLERLGRVFDRQISETLLDDYWQALRHLSLPVFAARVDAHIRTGKFFAKPRELLENPDGERRAADTRSPDVPGVDDWTATLNRVLRNVLMGVNGVPDETLEVLTAEKDRIAAQMREARVAAEEWADILPGVLARLLALAREARKSAGWPEDAYAPIARLRAAEAEA